jgi:hypothetical protein
VARNAFALALLTAAIALGGCSQIKGVLPGNKEEKAAEAKLIALRARTDSLRKARRVADSLAQVRYAACADSVRADMIKPAVAAKTKKRKKKPVAPPSDEMILARAQAVCPSPRSVPRPVVAASDSTSKQAAPDSARAGVAAHKAAQPAPAAAAAAPATPAPVAKGSAPVVQDSAAADSAQRTKELEMYRETFAYSGASRDPFNSLLNMAKTGPELADLQLVGIYQNLRTPDASIAVFREKDGGKRHKLRAGDQVGRSRLVQIRDREVVFMIEDFGFERQETLSLRKQEDFTP